MTRRVQIDAPPIPSGADALANQAATIRTGVGRMDTSSTAAGSRWLAALDRYRTPAFLISFILHTLLLLILAIWSVHAQVGIPTEYDFEASLSNVDADARQTELQLAADDAPAPPAAVPADAPQTTTNSESLVQVPMSELLQVRDSQKATESISLVEQLNLATSNLTMVSFAATGVEGRAPEQRADLAAARGGTLESELAVERALEWLAAHQLPSGGWSLVHDGGTCQGRCKNNGVDSRYEPAATGLALLAFLGAGYTHRSGKYERTVHDGLYYLMQIMEEVPSGGSFLHQSERGMYNHGIATFALCEGYQLTQDEDLRRAAQLAINFMLAAQNYAGGWGYLPKQPGDLTITGWQVMALKSAHAAGLDVPSDAIIRIDNFLGTQQVPSGVFYGYRKPDKHPTCSSIGVLIRLYRGWSHTDPRALELAQFLHKQGRSNGDAYFNYYATLLLFHIGGAPWEQWNDRMREHLIKTQTTEGHETGSWYFDNQYGKEGGRVYTTAMCAMTLEVYYRFSPLYQQADRPFEL